MKRYKQFSINCQTCVPTYQLRRWGFNIEAQGNTGTKAFRYLQDHYREAWTVGGKDAVVPFRTTRTAELWKHLNREDGIYQVECVWKKYRGEKRSGHTFTFVRENGQGYFYDPQTNAVFKNLQEFKKYSSEVSPKFGYQAFKTDGLCIDTKRIKDVIQQHKADTVIENAPKASRGGTTGAFAKPNGEYKAASGGSVSTPEQRLLNATINKQEAAKFSKEFRMARIFAEAGGIFLFAPEGAGYDGFLNGKRADLKSLTSWKQIYKKGRCATKKQGAEIVLFEFDGVTENHISELRRLAAKGTHGKYYDKQDGIVHVF